jgi:hypothetical protein
LLDLDLGFLVEIAVEPGLSSLFKFFHVVMVLLLFSNQTNIRKNR